MAKNKFWQQVLFVMVVALAISSLIWLGDYGGPFLSFIISLLLLVMGLNLTVYITRQSGMGTLFYLLTGVVTWGSPGIGISGWNKLVVFFLAGLVFEIFYFLLKENSIQIIISTSLSTLVIPLLTALFLSYRVASGFPLGLINLILMAFLVGVLGSTAVFLIWYHIRRIKPILKLRLALRN